MIVLGLVLSEDKKELIGTLAEQKGEVITIHEHHTETEKTIECIRENKNRIDELFMEDTEKEIINKILKEQGID